MYPSLSSTVSLAEESQRSQEPTEIALTDVSQVDDSEFGKYSELSRSLDDLTFGP